MLLKATFGRLARRVVAAGVESLGICAEAFNGWKEVAECKWSANGSGRVRAFKTRARSLSLSMLLKLESEFLEPNMLGSS